MLAPILAILYHTVVPETTENAVLIPQLVLTEPRRVNPVVADVVDVCKYLVPVPRSRVNILKV